MRITSLNEESITVKAGNADNISKVDGSSVSMESHPFVEFHPSQTQNVFLSEMAFKHFWKVGQSLFVKTTSSLHIPNPKGFAIPQILILWWVLGSILQRNGYEYDINKKFRCGCTQREMERRKWGIKKTFRLMSMSRHQLQGDRSLLI